MTERGGSGTGQSGARRGECGLGARSRCAGIPTCGAGPLSALGGGLYARRAGSGSEQCAFEWKIEVKHAQPCVPLCSAFHEGTFTCCPALQNFLGGGRRNAAADLVWKGSCHAVVAAVTVQVRASAVVVLIN